MTRLSRSRVGGAIWKQGGSPKEGRSPQDARMFDPGPRLPGAAPREGAAPRRPVRVVTAALRAGLVGLGLLLSMASGSPGERAETGQCPPGEVCSDATPSGLRFHGPSFGDEFLSSEAVEVTAVGGTQTLRVEQNALFSGPMPPFVAEVTNTAFRVTGVVGDNVTVQADAQGQSTLRILEPGTGDLFDRIQITALPMTRVTFSFDGNPWSGEDPNASGDLHYGPSPLQGIARLYNQSTRLVDQGGLSLWLPEPSLVQDHRVLHWDRFEVQAASDATHIIMGVQTRSGATAIAEVELAWAIDSFDIECQVEDPLGFRSIPFVPTSLVAGEDVLFIQFTGSLDGRPVHGLPLEADLQGPDEEPQWAEEDRPFTLETWPSRSVILAIRQPGTWHLHVTLANLSADYTITVTPAPPPSPSPSPLFGPSPSTRPAPTPQRSPRPLPLEASLPSRSAPNASGAPGWRASHPSDAFAP